MARLHVGAVARSHGLRGELKLHTFDHEAPSLRADMTVHLGSSDATARPYTLMQVRRAPDGLIIRLQELNDRTAADALRGQQVYVAEEDLPDLEEGERWAYQLIGYAVTDEAGTPLGEVSDVTAGTAHDFLVVKTPRGEVEIPLVEALVPRMDDEARLVVIRPIPGLLDEGEE